MVHEKYGTDGNKMDNSFAQIPKFQLGVTRLASKRTGNEFFYVPVASILITPGNKI